MRQRRLLKPKFRRTFTTLQPIKPVAPVTSMRSSGLTIKELFSVEFISISPFLLCSNVRTFYRIDAYKTKQSAEVVEQSDQDAHELALPQR